MSRKEEYVKEMANNRLILSGNPPQKEGLEALMEICYGCVLVSEENQRLDMEFENAALMEEFLLCGKELEGYDHMLQELYSACGRMEKTVVGHPHLMARFKSFYRQVVCRVEAVFCDGHELGLSGDLSREISDLELNIWYADKGEPDRIVSHGHLKADPIEWTATFENVIDDVEQEENLACGKRN